MQKTLLIAGGLVLGTIGVGQLMVVADSPDTGSRNPLLADAHNHVETAGPTTGGPPDVYVWALSGTAQWSDATHRAYSVGTTSCNQGGSALTWNGSNNQHPVISQNIMRVHDGRIEQLGQGWLKHGFCALDQTQCGSCQGTGCGSLGVGCSDPYTASRNGSQGSAGPKYQVNATTGFFNYPPADPSYSGATARRMRVLRDDVLESSYPGARYYVEGQYIHPQDNPADGTNHANNASYREMNLSSTGSFNGLTGSTITETPVIYAWEAVNPAVTIVEHEIPGEGSYFLGYLVTDNGDGTWTYEYALQNLNSDRSVRSFQVDSPDDTSLSFVDFHDVDYHSGEPWDGTDWAFTSGGDVANWATDTFDNNINANALRWGTLYNYRFVADAGPVSGNATMGLFKSGPGGDSFTVAVQAPDSANPTITMSLVNGTPDMIDPAGGDSFLVQIEELQPGGLIPGSAMFHYRENGGVFTDVALVEVPGPIGMYEAVFGPTECGANVEFYVSAETSEATTRVLPAGAPTAAVYSALSALDFTVVLNDNSETDPGWTVTNDPSLTTGAWERGIPIDDGIDGDPTEDYDGSGQCWVTENLGGNADVDGGPTILTSPAMDLSGLENAVLSYAWTFATNVADDDLMFAEISDDDGASWNPLATHDVSGGWILAEYTVGDYVALTSTVRIRFSVADNPNNSLTEAGIDAISITSLSCSNGTCIGDVNGDSEVGFSDLVELLAAWGPCPGCAADFDGSGDVGFADLVALLAAWGPCP